MSLPALTSLIDALDAHHQRNDDVKNAEAAWKAAQKAAKDTFAPLKALLSFKHGAPTSTAVLQRSLESGGDLAVLADAHLKAHPREVWRADGDPVAVKNSGLFSVWRSANAVRAVFGDGKKIDVYEMSSSSLSLAFSLKGDAHAAVLVDEETVRVLAKGGMLVELKNGGKKLRPFADFSADGATIAGAAVTATRCAAIRERTDDDGNARFSVVVDGVETALAVKHAMGPAMIGDSVYVCATNAGGDGGFAVLDVGAAASGSVSYAWLPRYDSGGSAPPRVENAHQFVAVDGETFVVTWGERGASARRWLRARDVVEDARFGPDFEGVDVCGGSVWSSAGDRVKDGKRTSPISFDGRCWATIAIDDDTVVCKVVDAKDKIALRRFRRHRA